jgi:hypothetical protein
MNAMGPDAVGALYPVAENVRRSGKCEWENANRVAIRKEAAKVASIVFPLSPRRKDPLACFGPQSFLGKAKQDKCDFTTGILAVGRDCRKGGAGKRATP